MGSPDPSEPRATGVWTLAGDRLIIASGEGPATILVPTEQVRLLAVDLPLPSRAKRLAALPFAIEDMIAEPLDSVHIALGGELASGRYLVGVVRHEVMARWVEIADEAGRGAAAMVPDVLVLPRPVEGWAVDQADGRAAVRASDGTGFAVPAPLLRSAWEAASRPRVHGYGDPLPDDIQATSGTLATLAPAPGALDLRQGAYAARRAALPHMWRRLGWIVALGAAAHVVIAVADTAMLRTIADRREADTRALVAEVAPGTVLGEDVAATVTGLLPSGAAGAPQLFFPLLNRVSIALTPLGDGLGISNVTFDGHTLILLTEPGRLEYFQRIQTALKDAQIDANVSDKPDGSLVIMARL